MAEASWGLLCRLVIAYCKIELIQPNVLVSATRKVMLCLLLPQARHPDMNAPCVLAPEPRLAGSGTGSIA